MQLILLVDIISIFRVKLVFIIFIGMRNFVTPRQKPIFTEKTLKVGKKALIIASVLAVAVLCSG